VTSVSSCSHLFSVQGLQDDNSQARCSRDRSLGPVFPCSNPGDQPRLHKFVWVRLSPYFLFMTCFSAALIIIKIWGINKFTARVVDNNTLKPVILVLLEAGAIYSCTLIALLICFFTGSWVKIVLGDAVSNS